MPKTLNSKDLSELVSLFRSKLRRLRELSQSGDTDDLIECGGIIRDLLFSDQNGLLGMILISIPELRTKRHKRIEFVVSHYGTTYHRQADRSSWFAADGIVYDPTFPFDQGSRKLSKDDFLKLPVIEVETETLTVKDVILFVANKLGGRHFSRDRTETNVNPLMYDIHDQFTLGGMSPSVRTLLGISNVVVATLTIIDDRLQNLGY